MVICQKCGYDNELGRIFCHSCGAKLNLSEIKSPSQGGKDLTKKKKGGAVKALRRVVNIVVLLVVVGTLVLALQVPALRPISTSNEDLTSVDKKRFALDGLNLQKTPLTITISETELNAFVDTLGLQKGEAKGAYIVPSKVQIELGDGFVTAIYLSKIHLAGSFEKQLYLSYSGVPTVEGGHFVFKPTGGLVGSLWIHPWILEKTGIFNRYYSKLFKDLGQEKQMLDSLASVSVTSKQVTLKYSPH
ncbi:MAG TPA: zinc ribbon domain-containing protein [Verrucomicrobiae bacterium]|nr:zinc ribbon domain-containing protein [Verrucomicrobiae bacterium]